MSNWLHPTTVMTGSVTFEGQAFTGPFCVLGQDGFQHATWSSTEFRRGSARSTTIGDGFRLLGHAAICAGTVIGKNFRGDFHVLIGEDCRIGDDVVVEYGARIYDRCVIGSNCAIGGFICNDSIIAEGCVVQGSLVHKRTTQGHEAAPRIQRNSFVGVNAVIVGAVVIGEGSIIGAGAVVTESTEPGFLYVGAPAQRVKKGSWQ